MASHRCVNVRVKGIVQGVGFRPFVYVLATKYKLTGFVLNDTMGVEIELCGPADDIDCFLSDLKVKLPAAARIDEVTLQEIDADSTSRTYTSFEIAESRQLGGNIATRISPDLAVCRDCLSDLFEGDGHGALETYLENFSEIFAAGFIEVRADAGFADKSSANTGSADTGCADIGSVNPHSASTGSADIGSADIGSADIGSVDTGHTKGLSALDASSSAPENAYHHYPYVNCTNCGPRFSIIKALPYDRPFTTMSAFPMCAACSSSYQNPLDRRFHAQPVACNQCGPSYFLTDPKLSNGSTIGSTIARGDEAIRRAVEALNDGLILAIKGIGGYHLALDASNKNALIALRERKYRRSKPFAIMVPDLASARRLACLDEEGQKLLAAVARPIVIAPAKTESSLAPFLHLISPDNLDIGLLLPYTPLHYLLFAAGAPAAMVFTSANISGEPIAYLDEDAYADLQGLADLFLIGERPIQRRIDDSVVSVVGKEPLMVRRSRGYAPDAVARLPREQDFILALGGDLKNTVSLSVGGQVFMSQYVGDLEHSSCFDAFEETIADLLSMYKVPRSNLVVAYDLHPNYRSSRNRDSIEASRFIGVQHHRAHIASVLAEHNKMDELVLGLAMDGTGYGDDQAIWGGEVFLGSVRSGFERICHLDYALLPGGDAAARFPQQALAGYLDEKTRNALMSESFFQFDEHYSNAVKMIEKNLRVFKSSSMGRLFDAVAALCGFVGEVQFEAQAAIWLEHQARGQLKKIGEIDRSKLDRYRFNFEGETLDFKFALSAVVEDRLNGVKPGAVALSFHLALAVSLADALEALSFAHQVRIVAASGGVMQNSLLSDFLRDELSRRGLALLLNRAVPPNDGGLSLGQVALASFS
ncbi:MAG: carbamoyltransferase HypF [Candidatus Melainabacteria bacterium]|nr:carbamoyltransferase HypF [Candidatus Melainabacteria bacterium]